MRKLGGLAIALLALVACEGGPSGPSVRFALPAAGLPEPLAVPFPSDLYRTDADGTIVDGLSSWTALGIDTPSAGGALAGYGALDGFGRQSGAVFAIDGVAFTDQLDPASLPADAAAGAGDASVAFVDIDPAAAVPGRRLPCVAGWDAATRTLTVSPEELLLPGHTYAAVVTSGVRFKDGRKLVASATFAAIRSGAMTSGSAKVYADALVRVVRDAGIARDRIVALTPLTTQTTHRGLRKIRDALAAGAYGPAPTLLTSGLAAPYTLQRFGASAHAGWTATLDEWLGTPRRGTDGRDLAGSPTAPEPATTGVGHDAVGAVLTSAFVSPELRRPFGMSGARDDGTIAFDAAGDAVPYDANQQIPVLLALPKGPAPAAGFPVVIFQHGVTGDRAAGGAVINELARAGIATVAIDAPYHGLRQSTAADEKSNAPGTFQGPDGLADTGAGLAPLDMAAHARNFVAARDNYWQAVLDLVQLRRLVGNCDLSLLADEFGGTAPTLDASRVGFIGMSMGGALGTLFAAVEPRSSVDPFVLDVPAARGLLIFTDGPTYNAQLVLFSAAAEVPLDLFEAGRHSAAFHLLQGLSDPFDAGVFAEDAAAEHNIFMMGAQQDEAVPRLANDTLVRALGATQVGGALRTVAGATQSPSPLRAGASGRVLGYYEVSPGGHGHLLNRFASMGFEPPYPRDESPRFRKLPARVLVRQSLIGAQAAVLRFLQTTWAGMPEIAVAGMPGLLPVPDFDDDGYCDDDERAAGTDPYDPASGAGTRACVRDVGFSFP